MKQRELTDAESVKWVCVQAFSGVVQSDAADEAVVRGANSDGTVNVACTPSGGAQSVHIRLASGWEESASDDQLLSAIHAQR